jgi:hypothetical protein
MILMVISIISVYIIMAILTAIVVYIRFVKKYVKEKSHMRFEYWIDGKIDDIVVSSLFWFVTIPTNIICFLAKKIIERINKHYGV